MPKRSRKPPQRDPQQIAGDILNQVVTNSGEVPPAVAKSAAVKSDDELRSDYAKLLGRRGGLKGGPGRAAKLTKEQLSEIGKKAAQARWTPSKKPKKPRK